jgi:hypothetical protein
MSTRLAVRKGKADQKMRDAAMYRRSCLRKACDNLSQHPI